MITRGITDTEEVTTEETPVAIEGAVEEAAEEVVEATEAEVLLLVSRDLLQTTQVTDKLMGLSTLSKRGK